MRSKLTPRSVFVNLLLAALALGVAASAGAQTPGFSKSFNPGTVGPGAVSTLTFTMTGSGLGVRELAFTDNLPAGMTIASPANAATDCIGGSASAPDGGDTIDFSGGDLPGSSSCTVTVDVVATATATNVSGDLTSTAGNSGNASATLTVDTGRPGFSKSFSPAAVFFGGRSKLTFTVDNSANPQSALSLNFTDNLPFGMTVASPSNAAKTCAGGLLTAIPGSSVVSYGFGGATSTVGANSTCTISVDVSGGAIGVLGNTSGDFTSQPGPAGGIARSSGKAADTLTVTVEQISLTKEFVDDPAAPGGTVDLAFTVRNLDRRDNATAISFTDDLDLTLSGLEAVGLPADPCGAGSSVSGTGFLTFSGGSLGIEESCTFTVTLQVPSTAAAGAYVNTTSAITADVGGVGAVGDPASDELFVAPAPSLTKTFIGDPVGAGGSITLEFTITNTSPTSAATEITFEDVFVEEIQTASFVPAGGFCGLDSTAIFTPLIDSGTGSIPARLVIAGASLDPADSCTFSVILDIFVTAQTNTYNNTTSEITATVDGETVTGNPASDSFDMVAAPALIKEFTDDPVAPGGTVSLEFTLTHDENAPGAASDVTFTDDLAATLSGLTATGLPASDVCGGGSQIDGTTDLLLTGGSLEPGESCTFAVNLDVPPTAAAGSHGNTTSNVVATVLGVTATGNPGSDDLRIAGLTLTKDFTDDPVRPGETVDLRYTIQNSHPTASASEIAFTDDLDDALDNLAATGLPVSDVCGDGSSLIGQSGGTRLVFSGGSLDPGELCTFDVTLLVPSVAQADTYVSATSSFSATVEGATVVFDNASDELTVAGDFVIFTKDFLDDSAAPGSLVDLEFTLTNVDSKTLFDLEFTDDLDAGLPGLVSVSGTVPDVCGSGSSISGTSVLTFTGGTLAMATSCTFSVTLSVPADVVLGTVALNVTSELTGTIVGFPFTGDPASDELTIDFLSFGKAFAGEVFAGNAVELTFTIHNLSTSETAADLSFSDDLDAVLSGLTATGLPANDVCGVGSVFSGTSVLTMTGGNLLPGGSCTFSVDVEVPAGALGGDYLNVTSDLRLGPDVAVGPASAVLTVSSAPDSDGDGIADGVDNCPAIANSDQSDADGDGLGDVCDVCVFDAGNDADGDGVCASDGDCDDDDAATFPGADELCDDVDQNCDGELELATACDAECGNSAVDVNPLPAPACPDPGVMTVIETRAELDAWLADPTTSADVKEDIDLGGDDLVVSTACDFTSRQNDDLTGIGSAYVAARDIDLQGDLVAGGQLTLRAAGVAITRQSSGLSAGTGVAIEALEVDLHASNDSADLCAEGDEVLIRQASSTTSTGSVLLIGDTVDVHGDFAGASIFAAVAFGDLFLRQAASVAGGDVSLDAGGLADVHGDVVATGAVAVSGAPVMLSQASQISGAGSVDFSGLGAASLDWHGQVTGSGDVTVTSTAGLIFRQAGRIETNGDVTIDVPDLEARGKIRFNGDVVISADSYELFGAHDFQSNASCTITGTPVPGSQPPNGCTAQ